MGLRWVTIVLFLAVCSLVRDGAGGITPSPFWKNRIVFPNEPFRAVGLTPTEPSWVKFTILTSAPTTVYFQDCREYKFHYDFAAEQLDPFLGIGREDYDRISLYAQGQQAILGAVIFDPQGIGTQPQSLEYGIQFVRRDAYSREMIRDLFNTVKANVFTSPGVEVFYFPTFEQMGVAETYRTWFESQGIPISSPARWVVGNIGYSYGWALGTLKFFRGNEIESAYRSGSLLPSDILLTDGVPAEVPFVAGILSQSPSTPNSHVAILAQSHELPFAYLAAAEDVTKALQLVGHKVVVLARDKYGTFDLRIADANDLTSATVAEILGFKKRPPLQIKPMVPYGRYSESTEGLLPQDIEHFGGKAANFGILRTSIPNNCPVATAFSFDLWNAYLDQRLAGGTTLRDEIATRLSRYTTYPPPNMAALSVDLAAIRDLFKSSATTMPLNLRNAIIVTLTDPQYGFDPNKNLRFRSSTNVEDSEQFVGAGLYDSFSGCLADDLDGDDAGPCLCDPVESGERGVFRAIRKVFASFYNENAFLERLRFGVRESDVGMALLVHHSTPDPFELANGVATVDKKTNGSCQISLVTQNGAVPVTNPENGAIPEEVKVSVNSSGIVGNVTFVRSSNLVPLGSAVMSWKDDYTSLGQLLFAVGGRYGHVTGKQTYLLDLEYKKVAPTGSLRVKQVREVPRAANTPTTTPFLVNDPTEYVIYQGEFGNVFANHRLKLRWLFQTDSLRLTSAGLQKSLYGNCSLEYAAEGRIRLVTGKPSSWPAASHTCTSSTMTDAWTFSNLPGARRHELTTRIPQLSVPVNEPLIVLNDFANFDLTVRYNPPVCVYDPHGRVVFTSQTDEVRLWPTPRPQSDDVWQTRTFRDAVTGTSITTIFYEPKPTFIGTQPLARWVQTTIEGLTNEPIILRGYYSQTYHPAHHSFYEDFLFEPGLESGISPGILRQLRLKNIQMIYLYLGGFGKPSYIAFYGFDPGQTSVGQYWSLYK